MPPDEKIEPAKLKEHASGAKVREEEKAAMLHPALAGVRAVLFDVGGTLLHPDWERLARLASRGAGREFDPAELGRKFKEMMCAVDAAMGRGEPAPEDSKRRNWVFRRVYRALEIDEATCESLSGQIDATHAERHLWCAPDGEAARVLGALKAAGLRLAVISNTEDGRLDELLELVGLKQHFELSIDSHVVGLSKPDPGIFQLTLARLGLEPREAAFIGDSYAHDALAARAAGMRGILLDPLGLYPESVCPRIGALGELIGQQAAAGESGGTFAAL
ncbi:MAG TPA: HAD-IA family hydrolase [Pyrinomonadaceae bacterium]|nr:HAD-IA family hydrolase [Pyrinomonadaceae bacterium]